MSKSYMRVNSWPQGAPERRPVESDWKAEVAEELAEDEVTEIFMIENSYYIGGGDDEGHANMTAWPTEESAQDELWRLANQQGIIIDPHQTSFEDGDDTYFINRYELGEI